MTNAPDAGSIAGLTRAALPDRTLERLSRGGRANPDVLLVRSDAGPVIVKDYAPRGAWIRAGLAPLLVRREARAYERLAGHPAVPRLLGCLDALALVLEYRPGVNLSRSLAVSLPASFLPELRDAVAAMHARGVAHLDLRHRSNVLADAEGHPVLIDFASTLLFRPDGAAARWLLPWVARVDEGALRKWEERLRPQDSPPAASATTRGTPSAGSRGASLPR